MDLVGQFRKNTPKKIIDKYQGDACLHYNWGGWRYIISFLNSHGVDITDFSGSNDGKLIKRSTCTEVAKYLKKYIHELPITEQVWLWPHIEKWEWVRNYKQY